ncbi:MAG TPA: ABC transporter ATP-binding protein [Gaiellaceae bacterium]|jgi:peptide/nickel transport system ATP-binding protein|nr:ABC transporter ATP-binding protein [Gaiellaceae bacterium]
MARLEVTDLNTSFRTDDGIVKAVSGVSFKLEEGRTLGVVGESGSGKSVTFLSVMGLLDPRQAQIAGSVLLDDEELLGASSATLRQLRGRRIGMIFQDPMTSLNPVKSIGWQLEEAVLIHNDVSRKEARRRSVEILKQVEIPRAEQRIDDYPHQFSGGMRQRVMIAMALINNPDILIADEPTTALDVTTQAQILRLMKQLQGEFKMGIVMITHDLGVVAEVADDVIVMYGGKVVEQANVDDLFANPEMPYTWGLLGSLPRLNSSGGRLDQIPGQPPSLLNPPSGCPFHPRCEYVMDICRRELPALEASSYGEGHRFRCHLDDETRTRIWSQKRVALGAEETAA